GGGGGGEGARGRQEGGDAVPLEARRRADRGQEPRGQHRAHQEQRHSRRAGGGGAREALRGMFALERLKHMKRTPRATPREIALARGLTPSRGAASISTRRLWVLDF